LRRSGRVYVRKQGDDVWVGGDVVDVVKGEVEL
jgi:predicted PhzF superfamily epimerase YddE/YHI9